MVTVTKEKALGQTAIWRALDLLCSVIAGLPLEVFERKADGDNLKAISNPLYFLLHDQPHELYTSYDFRRALILNLVNPANGGNSFAKIERDRNARVLGLRILPPGMVETYLDPEEHKIYYRITDEPGPVAGLWRSSDLLHIKGLSENGVAGYNNSIIFKDALGNIIAQQEFIKNHFENGAHIDGVLERPLEAPVLSDNAVDHLGNVFADKYGGIQNSGRVPVLQEGTKFIKISATPTESAQPENRRMNISEVARMIGVPEHLLSSLERATFNNIEHLTQQWVKFGLSPLCKQIEQEMNRKLLRESERGTFFIRHNLEGLLRGDVETRTKYYESALKYGWLSRDEVRHLENFNKIPTGEGNQYLIPLNMGTIQQMETLAENQTDNQTLANES